MGRARLAILSAWTLSFVAVSALGAESDQKERAERFFRGVYGCNPEVVDELASEDVILSYPIFETLFGEGIIRGREAARRFASGFCDRWADAEVTIHEAIEEGNQVVLVWSFRARQIGSLLEDQPAAGEVRSWGGMALYRFDADGRISAEIGEESTPGPFARSTAREPVD